MVVIATLSSNISAAAPAETAADEVETKCKVPKTSPSKRLAARREAFLAAAEEVFRDKGFAEATLDDIIARSRGSRQTLYALFGGKQGLFEALVNDACEKIFAGLTPEELAPRPTETALVEIGIRYLTVVTSPACLNLNRLLIAEAPRFPELAQRFWELGPARSRAFLAAFFERQIEREVLQMQDSSSGADHFLEMLSGTVRLQCLIGLRQPPTPEEIEEIARGAVLQFLHGCSLQV